MGLFFCGVLVGQFNRSCWQNLSSSFCQLTSEVFFVAVKCYAAYKFESAEWEMTDTGSNGNNLPILSSEDLLLLLSFKKKKKNVVWRIRQSGEPGARAGADKQARALSGQSF